MNRPRVVIFNCTSLDGRMDGGMGQVDMGLYYQLAASWNADAMLSGSETMLAAFGGTAFAGPAEPPPPSPALVGGQSPQSMFVAHDVSSPEQAIPLRLAHFEQVGEDRLWLRYQVVR